MSLLKSKTTIILIIMVLGVSYIGGIESSSLEDSNDNDIIEINNLN